MTKTLNDKEMIKALAKERKCSQNKLAENAGMSRTNVAGYLNRGNNAMRCDTFVKLLSAMGYDVVIRDRYNAKGEEYILSFDTPSESATPKKKNLMRHEELLQNYSPSCFRTVLSGTESTALDSRWYTYKTKADWLNLFMEAIEDLNAGNLINGKGEKNETDYWYKQIRLVTEFTPKPKES